MVENGPRNGAGLSRRVLRVRAAIYAGGAAILVAAGVGRTAFGMGILGAYSVVVIWSLVESRKTTRRQIGIAEALIDVLAPSVTGLLVGHDPYSLHLLVAAQIAACFLVSNPRVARLVGAVGVGGMALGLIGANWPTPVVLTETGYRIAENGAVVLGAVLGLMTVSTVATRMWAARNELKRASITERRHTETMRRFVSMVNHELRTPLTSISGYASVLRDSDPSLTREERIEFLDVISDQSQHLSRLVDDILVLLRMEAGRLTVVPEIIPVAEIAARVVQLIDLPPDRTLDVRVDGDVSAVADPDRLLQVIRNLVENAVKYGGPHIRIEVDRVGASARVRVCDDGSGIPDDRVEEVFEDYARLDHSPGGFGLGLPIVKRLVEAMDGTIEYVPASSGSICFVVTLPSGVATSSARRQGADPSASLGSLAG